MQDSEGKLELCPFRIRREQSYDNPNIFTEMFTRKYNRLK